MGLFNFGMKCSFDKSLKLIAGVNDLFNEGPKQLIRSQYTDAIGTHKSFGNAAYPQQGRTYYMTVEYSF